MSKVTYDDVKWIFNNHGYKKYFYPKAWETIDKKGLADYSDGEELINVFLRAAALDALVGQFEQASDENTYSFVELIYMLEDIEEYYSDQEFENYWFVIGQMFNRVNEEKEITDDLEDCAFYLMLSKFDETRRTIESGLGVELYVTLYAINHIDDFLLGYGDMFINDNGEEEESEGEFISSYDTFWSMIERHEGDIAAYSERDSSLVRGYAWLSEGTPVIGYR